jgi:hypothetical protein
MSVLLITLNSEADLQTVPRHHSIESKTLTYKTPRVTMVITGDTPEIIEKYLKTYEKHYVACPDAPLYVLWGRYTRDKWKRDEPYDSTGGNNAPMRKWLNALNPATSALSALWKLASGAYSGGYALYWDMTKHGSVTPLERRRLEAERGAFARAVDGAYKASLHNTIMHNLGYGRRYFLAFTGRDNPKVIMGQDRFGIVWRHEKNTRLTFWDARNLTFGEVIRNRPMGLQSG